MLKFYMTVFLADLPLYFICCFTSHLARVDWSGMVYPKAD
jgi:hypothetical protein